MSEFLFPEFESVSAKQWKQKIQYDLRGADYNETLVWQSPEGIHVKPFYHQDDFKEAFTPIPGQPENWSVVQDVFIDDEAIANRLALDAITRGAEAILFGAEKEFDMEVVFKDFPFEKASIYFDLNFLSEDFLKTLKAYFKNASEAKMRYHIDAVGTLARTGNWFHNKEKDFEILAAVTGSAADLSVDATLYQNAGANIIQQLAYALAHANEYLNYFDNKSKDHLNLTFKFSLGSNYFFEIAKLRAFRKLYATLAKEYGGAETCHIVAMPSKRNKTIYDYNVNLLRTTSECMSAVLGGADAVCNMAYDALYHKSNEFGERIARNQLLVLKNESYFGIVGNPVDGTYYIESLTDELATKALEVFKEIEKAGGIIKQLYDGVIQRKIKESAAKEQERFDAEELKLLGTNYHINPNDRMKHQLELFPFLKRNPVQTTIEPILEKRLAEEVEQKRLKQES